MIYEVEGTWPNGQFFHDICTSREEVATALRKGLVPLFTAVWAIPPDFGPAVRVDLKEFM